MSAQTPGPTDPPPYGGRTLIVDTSAWVVLRKALARGPQPAFVGDFVRARANGQLRGHTAVKLELLHNARGSAELLAAEARLDELPTLRITATASDGAVSAVRDLAAAAPPGDRAHHRVGHGDALVAATAAEHGFGVLHYDRHFERLAKVLGIDHCWIAKPGDY